MSPQESVRALITALQSGDMELAASLMCDDFSISGLTPHALDKNAFLAMQDELLIAMPDFSYNLQDLSQREGKVHALVQITGTHTDILALPMFGLEGIEATGLAVTLPQVPATFQVEDDKVKAMALEPEPGAGLSGLLQQVGAEIPLAPRERNITD